MGDAKGTRGPDRCGGNGLLKGESRPIFLPINDMSMLSKPRLNARVEDDQAVI